MAKMESSGQLIWGMMLVGMGLALVYRIPQVMPRILQIEQFSELRPFLYFCFYLMAVLLIGGGGWKIYLWMKPRLKS